MRGNIEPLRTPNMGIYDRDYNRDGSYSDAPGFNLGGQRTMATNLVILTSCVYLGQLLLGPWVSAWFDLPDDWYLRPWQAYRLLTYGFLHDPDNLLHLLLNMFILWMFGREVELKYGRREFLVFYLCAIVVAGLAWSAAELPFSQPAAVLGASGGVTGLLILYALNFPRRTVLFMMVIPMPMWVMALILVAIDVKGSMDREGTIACTAHLGGAAFALLYWWWGGRLENWLPSGSWRPSLKRKAKLRVHDPDMYAEPDEQDESDEQVDEILRKIQQQGQESLTWRERRILEKASREYQKKRR